MHMHMRFNACSGSISGGGQLWQRPRTRAAPGKGEGKGHRGMDARHRLLAQVLELAL